MNAVRVFLHDLAWNVDPAGFLDRLERFLSAAAGLGIRTIFHKDYETTVLALAEIGLTLD
jgi:hypothetical protein